MPDSISINRAPLLTLWAAVVAERLDFGRADRADAGPGRGGPQAHARGVSLGIVEPEPDLVRERGERLADRGQLHVDLLGRAVPVGAHPGRAASVGRRTTPSPWSTAGSRKASIRLRDARALLDTLR